MKDSEFEQVLLESAKNANIPLESVIATTIDLHGIALSYGFSFSKETDKVADLDSNLDAEIEVEEQKQEDEEGSSLFKHFVLLLGNVAKNIVFPSVSNLYKDAAKEIVKHGLLILRAGHLLFGRLVVGTVLNFVGHCINVFRVLLRGAFTIIKWAIKIPPVRTALLAAGAAGAAFVVGKYITSSDEEKQQYKVKAKSILDDLLGVNDASSNKEPSIIQQEKANSDAAYDAYLTSIESLPDEVKQVLLANDPDLPKKIEDAKQREVIRQKTENRQQQQKETQQTKEQISSPKVVSSISDQAFAAILASKTVPKLDTPDKFDARLEILATMVKEGWNKLDKSSPLNYSRFGINFNKHRSKAFIDSLTAEQAYNIYKKEYWDAAGVDQVPEELRRIYFNTAVNMDPGKAKKLLKQSDGTIEGFSTAKWNEYNRLARANPFEYAKYLKGWRRRVIAEYNETIDILEARIKGLLSKEVESRNQQYADSNQTNSMSDKQYSSNGKQIVAYEL